MSLVHFSLTRIFSISTNNYRKKHKMGSTASFGTIIHMNIIWSFTHIGTIAAKKEREYSVHVNNKITDQNGKYTVWCFLRSVVSMCVCVCVCQSFGRKMTASKRRASFGECSKMAECIDVKSIASNAKGFILLLSATIEHPVNVKLRNWIEVWTLNSHLLNTMRLEWFTWFFSTLVFLHSKFSELVADGC